MSDTMSRRSFLERSAGAVLAAGMAGAAARASGEPAAREERMAAEGPMKAVIYGMLPDTLSMDERFKLARDVGFAGVEVSPVGLEEAEKMRAAADRAGIPIHSIIFGGWGTPLSAADEDVRKRGLAEVESALRSAKVLGADGVLLVPGVVNAQTRYVDAYTRSQAAVRKLIPIAEELRVRVLIENVWNNFLLSPLEFARYLDEIDSPWVQAYFDVGNVVRFAWPQDWIRTLGKRIRKVHIKDFKGGPGLGTGGEWVNLREGSIDWPEVRRALTEIAYTGYMTTELGGGDEAYLRDLSARFDRILAGE